MSQETQTTITITGAAGRYEVHDSRASAFAGLPSRFERLIEAEAHVAAVASTGDIVVGKIEDPNFRHAASMLRAHLAARRAGRSHNFARAAIAIIIAYTSRGIPRGEVDRILEAAVDASTAASSARSLEDRRREAGADEALDHRASAAAVRATIRATVVLDRIVSGLPAPKVADYEGALAVFLELEVRSQTWRRSGVEAPPKIDDASAVRRRLRVATACGDDNFDAAPGQLPIDLDAPETVTIREFYAAASEASTWDPSFRHGWRSACAAVAGTSGDVRPAKG